MRVALTGHRPQRLGLPDDETADGWEYIAGWLSQQIIKITEVSLLEGEKVDLYCGMASGCDITFGLVSAILKERLDCKLHCILPCKNYNSSHKLYNSIKEQSDEWIELSDEFYKGCDNARDQYMVDHCDILLAIWDGNKSGGVWSTIRKAQKAGKQIIYCPKEILSIE